ncbi:hypothetical protein H6P81_007503 [Aristolochia fimbriata]|uniref:non-specific serine/threonine protein kinase n=1 Tax=Aristolochia fimbriata TaxID=158543 RepID=A0AAV7F1R6_ARIFI|nr:hypothetical protein H6P81_007503 [Aristolochia fimbriata]
MSFKVVVLALFLLFHVLHVASEEIDFTYNGFGNSSFSLGGITIIKPNGLMQLTNTVREQKGQAFYPVPLPFKNNSSNNRGNAITRSFSSTFIFAIVPEDRRFYVQGLAFVISPFDRLSGSLPAQYIGLFNSSNNDGSPTNHIFAVEFDTSYDTEFGDINDNHVGIDINSLHSVHSAPAGYFSDGGFTNFSLRSGDPIQVWIDYSGGPDKQLDVTVSPIKFPKPDRPLHSLKVDLDPVLLDKMYVGFSSATCELPAAHYILGWSFKMDGRARSLNLSSIPSVPRTKSNEKSKFLTVGFPLIALTVGLMMIVVHRDIKASNVLLDAEMNGRLGDFGLARLYDRGTAPNTTHVVGTLGYMAPELTKTSRATTSTDVFAFGAFVLEVATGRRPIELRRSRVEQMVLVDWVAECRKRGAILDVCDPKLGKEYVVEEMELVLKLGLLCSHPLAAARPSMREVIQFLERDCPFPESWWNYLECSPGSDGFSTTTSSDCGFLRSSSNSVSESLLSGGR